MSNKIKSEQQPCSDGEEGPLLQNHPLALLGCISPSSPTPYLGSQPSCYHHPGSSTGQESWDTQNPPSAWHTPPGNTRYKLRSWNLKSWGHQWVRTCAHTRIHDFHFQWFSRCGQQSLMAQEYLSHGTLKYWFEETFSKWNRECTYILGLLHPKWPKF